MSPCVPAGAESARANAAAASAASATAAIASVVSAMVALPLGTLAAVPDTMYYWQHGGQDVSLAPCGSWWAAVPEQRWPKEPAASQRIRSTFHGDEGDRRQDVVFIGVGIDPAAIAELLDTCLVSPAASAR